VLSWKLLCFRKKNEAACVSDVARKNYAWMPSQSTGLSATNDPNVVQYVFEIQKWTEV
jgi:hypothetical protein